MKVETHIEADECAKERQPSLGKLLCILALTVALGIPGALYSGLVLQDLWGWFVEPLGAPKIGLIQAVGLLLIVAFARGLPKRSDHEMTFRRTFSWAGSRLLFVSLGWGLGAIWHAFMPA